MDSKSNMFIFTETPAFHVCWFAALAGGLLVDQYHPIARPEIWIQLPTPDWPLPRWLDKIPKVFTHKVFFTLSLFLQCSVHFFCFSLSSHISPLFPLPLQLIFSSSPLFVSLRFLHIDKALVSLFRCRMFWLLRRTAEYFITPLENMDMKHVFPV